MDEWTNQQCMEYHYEQYLWNLEALSKESLLPQTSSEEKQADNGEIKEDDKPKDAQEVNAESDKAASDSTNPAAEKARSMSEASDVAMTDDVPEKSSQTTEEGYVHVFIAVIVCFVVRE